MQDENTFPHRLAPLERGHAPELQELFSGFIRTLGFVPNSSLVMQRRPKMVQAFAAMSGAVWDKDNSVDPGFKRLLGFVAAQAMGCRYSMAHTVGGALLFGVDEAKLKAIGAYRTSPLYSEAERAALDFAAVAAGDPTKVSDAMLEELKAHWDEGQMAEIAGLIAMQAYLSRWNTAMATPLEDEALKVGEKYLAARGWTPGRHAS